MSLHTIGAADAPLTSPVLAHASLKALQRDKQPRPVVKNQNPLIRRTSESSIRLSSSTNNISHPLSGAASHSRASSMSSNVVSEQHARGVTPTRTASPRQTQHTQPRKMTLEQLKISSSAELLDLQLESPPASPRADGSARETLTRRTDAGPASSQHDLHVSLHRLQQQRQQDSMTKKWDSRSSNTKHSNKSMEAGRHRQTIAAPPRSTNDATSGSDVPVVMADLTLDGEPRIITSGPKPVVVALKAALPADVILNITLPDLRVVELHVRDGDNLYELTDLMTHTLCLPVRWSIPISTAIQTKLERYIAKVEKRNQAWRARRFS